jgi:thimet oligopeptidase
MLKWNYTFTEIINLCDVAMEDTKIKIQNLISSPNSNKSYCKINNHDTSKLLQFELIMSNFSDKINPLIFLSNVSTSADVVKAALDCENKVNKFTTSIYTNKILYQKIKDNYLELQTNNELEYRLYKKIIRSFEINGTHLENEKLEQVRNWFNELDVLENKFSAELNADVSFVDFTLEELKGVPLTFLNSLNQISSQKETSYNEPKTFIKKYRIYTKEPLYATVMENATYSETRRKMLFAFNTRAPQNLETLKYVLILRLKIANLLGFKTWLEYKTFYGSSTTKGTNRNDYQTKGTNRNDYLNSVTQDDKSLSLLINKKEDVYNFLEMMIKKFKPLCEKELKFLQLYKDTKDKLGIEDMTFLFTKIKKENNLDVNLLQEYFPLEHVIKAMFKFFGDLFNINFNSIKGDVWADNVNFYEIRNNNNDMDKDNLIGYFYTDFLPRKGKYGHAAAFDLILGKQKDNEYVKPVAAIVANFSVQKNTVLLKFDEVETLFHEFGHIMHQTLTKVAYSSLSGTNIKIRFVEAPSQMLEKFLYEKETLKLISKHYLTKQPLPDNIIENIILFENFSNGYYYMRQIVYSLFDLQLHDIEDLEILNQLNINKFYSDLCKKYIGITPLEGSKFAASFCHLMEYDASYYVYLYSEVYADNLYEKFDNNLKERSKIGLEYRTKILERGDLEDFPQLVKDFLGHDVKLDVFFQIHGLKSTI